MRALLLMLTLAAAAACGPREVIVRTAADLPAESILDVQNKLAQAVNVYVVDGGQEIFLRQVAPGGREQLRVRGVAPGRRVTLRATTRDGTRTYTRENVSLEGTYQWSLP